MPNKKGHIIRFLLLTFTLVGLGIFHFFYSYDEVKYFAEDLRTHVETDVHSGGHSEGKILLNKDSTLSYEYILKEGVKYPFSNLSMWFKKGTDLSDFTKVEFSAKSNYPNRRYIVIGVRYNDGSDLPTHFVDAMTETDSSYKKFSIYLDDLKTPDWWMARKNLGNKPPTPDFSKVQFLSYGSGTLSELNRAEQVSIKNIKFIYENKEPYNYFYGFLGIISLEWFVFWLIKRKQNKVAITYEATKEEKEEKASVVDYISANYMEPDLSLNKVSNDLGLSETKVSAQIKETTKLTFKQLLNQIRMEEAKRLLLNSDLRVSEIAYKVGFENVTHFNRIFKQFTDISPSSFRKSSKQGES